VSEDTSKTNKMACLCKTRGISIFRISTFFANKTSLKPYSSDVKQEGKNEGSKLSGFAKSFIKHETLDLPKPTKAPEENFASLLRNSKFIDVSFSCGSW